MRRGEVGVGRTTGEDRAGMGGSTGRHHRCRWGRLDSSGSRSSSSCRSSDSSRSSRRSTSSRS
eukprot:1512481-Pyramimonas_sp.AAC.1